MPAAASKVMRQSLLQALAQASARRRQVGAPRRVLGEAHAGPRRQFRTQPADHVDHLRALFDHEIPRAMRRQRRLLLGRLHRHEAHRRPCHRLANRLSVVGVSFAGPHVGLHVSRRHQFHRMPKPGNFSGPICEVPHASMPTRQGPSFVKKGMTWLRRSVRRNTAAPASSAPCTWKTKSWPGRGLSL